MATTSSKFNWKALNKQQVGAYCEYFVKMEMTMHGFQVYTPEVDDRGIDFVCRYGDGEFIEIQVKSIRQIGNVFLFKSKFKLSKRLYLALGLMLQNGEPPILYLIPSLAWTATNSLFVSNDYGQGKTSKPEWRLNISARNKGLLAPYVFDETIGRIVRGDW